MQVYTPDWRELVESFTKYRCGTGICVVLQDFHSNSRQAIHDILKKNGIEISEESLTRTIAMETYLIIQMEAGFTSIAANICRSINPKLAYCTVWVDGKIITEN